MTIATDLKHKLEVVAKKVTPGPSNRQKVIVIGSQYHVGHATLLALRSLHDDSVQAFAGTDDKIQNSLDIDGIQYVKADLADKVSLARSLVGYDSAYIVVPGKQKGGVQFAVNGIEAAKEAGVKFVLLMSVIGQDSDESTSEKEFQPIRDAVEASGLDYAIVRLPLEPETLVAVGDVGKESAKILADPSEHVGKEYRLEAATQ